jgi:4-hydroxy-4-methyl-2-oxoglutarate aldolase
MTMGIAVRNIHRADAQAIAALERLGVATVHEAQGRTGLMAPYLRPLWRGARIAGSAVTALCHPGDNWMIHVAVELLQAGDVLVVACTSESTDGAFGELLATALATRGAKGVVLDVGCRDAAEITEMRFPVWSRAVSAKGTVKATLGSVNVPVVCAGVCVRPGDVVVADDDGVVIVPRAEAAKVAAAGAEREAKEAGVRERLKKGEVSLDIYGMRAALAQKGLKYVDGPLEE